MVKVIPPLPSFPPPATQTLISPRNDILRKHGVIPEKPADPEPVIQEALLEAHLRAHDNRLEDKTLDQLHDLEDDEDVAFLESYRRKRLQELSRLTKNSVHGQVYPLQKADYARDVTEASAQSFVPVHLSSSSDANVESRVLSQLWRQLAQRFGEVKFCEIRADMCIENYPERNTPTILVYRNGDIVRQVVTLRELGGTKTTLQSLQNLLVEIGVVTEDDVRVRESHGEDVSKGKISRGIRSRSGDEDDDWD